MTDGADYSMDRASLPNPSVYASEDYLVQLLGKAVAAKASDIHLKVGQPPGARVHGEIVYFRADARAHYGTVMDAIDAVRTAGVEEVGMLTEQQQPSSTTTRPPTAGGQ